MRFTNAQMSGAEPTSITYDLWQEDCHGRVDEHAQLRGCVDMHQR